MTQNGDNRTRRIPRFDIDRLHAWLDEHWKSDGECPVCGKSKWQVDEDPYRLDPFQFPGHGTYIVRHDTRLVLPVMCLNCGYIMMFDAARSGALWFDDMEGDESDE